MSEFTEKVYEITEDFRKKAVKKELELKDADQLHEEVRSHYPKNLDNINPFIEKIQREDIIKVQYFGGYRPINPTDFAAKSLLYADKIIIRDTLPDILLWRETVKPEVFLDRMSSLMKCYEEVKPLADSDLLEIVPGAEYWNEKDSEIFTDIIHKRSEIDSKHIEKILPEDVISANLNRLLETSSPIVYIPKAQNELRDYATKLLSSSLASDINSSLILSQFLRSEVATDIWVYWLSLKRILEKRQSDMNQFFQAFWCIDLPFLKGVSIEKVIRIREEYEEPFKNWREEFRRRCRELKKINDPLEFYDVAKEKEKEIVKDCQKLHSEVRNIKEDLFLSGVLTTGSIVISCFIGNPISAILGLGGLGGMVRKYLRSMEKVKENPMYFLFKVT
jgi:hypothetical protein